MKKRIISLLLAVCMVLSLVPTMVFAVPVDLSGDINGDGVVNVNDAREIQKYLVGLTEFDESQIALVDNNGDGKQNIFDCTNILKYISGLDVSSGGVQQTGKTPPTITSIAGSGDTLKVNATSNYFPAVSTTAEVSDTSPNETVLRYVTVTYFVDSTKDVLDLQWTLSYDPAYLTFISMEYDTSSILNLMPVLRDEYYYNVTSDGDTNKIKANATDLDLYKFSDEECVSFVTATFRVDNPGETEVNLFVECLTLSDGTTEETAVNSGVVNEEITHPNRFTAAYGMTDLSGHICMDFNKDHNCDYYGCRGRLGFCDYNNYAFKCDYCGATISVDNIEDNKYTYACESIDSQYFYSQHDLGATYTPESTTFKVWAPTASAVILNLYASGSADESREKGVEDKHGSYEMTYDETSGVWSTFVEGDFKNVYYTYTITAKSVGSNTVTTKETQDIYSVATGINGNRSMVCDLDSTDPEGWENDDHVLFDESTDSVVWEIHIKDFSYDPDSGVSEKYRGKYLAFTETGTTLKGNGKVSTGIDYLKELGVTTVQINPFFDFASINEAGADTQFNWGYDPQHFNVPEGSYSSNPYDGNVRINECKSMIKALHDAGISVVMDVDYTHTYLSNCFQATVPDYYYRMTNTGAFSNSSGNYNECATERAMYREFVIQSLLYWVNEYHVDGFNFNSMALMDVETMNLIREALDGVDPRITTWGEGWAGGDSYHPTYTCTGEKYYPATQANAAKLNDRIALYNDVIRDGIKGFVQGATASAPDIRYGVRANSFGRYKWLSSAPSQCVSYASNHDNATLYDKILGATWLAPYGVRESTAVKMNKLGGAIVYTSQGIQLMLAGEEMCRSKDGDTNSYKSAATLNMIKWQNVVDYADVVSYYKGLGEIRSRFTPLTCADDSYSDAYIFNGNMTDDSKQIAFTITNDTLGEWNKMAVIYNSDSVPAEITLKDTSVTEWVVIANGDSAGLEKLDKVSGSTFTVPAYTALIAVDEIGFETAGIDDNTGKVTVNYLYEDGETKLTDSVVLTGTIGTGYQTVSSPEISGKYLLKEVIGNTYGKFDQDDAVVNYIYKNIPIVVVGEGSGNWLYGEKDNIYSEVNRMTAVSPLVYEITYTEIAQGDYECNFYIVGKQEYVSEDGTKVIVPYASADVKLRLDLTDYDFETKEDADITVTVTPHHYHDFSDDWATDDTYHWHECLNEDCNETRDKAKHTGGEATCTEKAVCQICYKEYGKFATDNHTGEKVWTTTETQHKQYWNCCDVVVVDTEDHTWVSGVCSKCDYTCAHKDEDKDHECDICGENVGVHADKNSDHNCDYCGEQMTTCKDENPKDHKCDICRETLSDHAYDWQSENGQYWQKCSYCGDETEKKDIPTITISGEDVVCKTQDYRFVITVPEGVKNVTWGYDFERMGTSNIEPTIEDGEMVGILQSDYYADDENGVGITVMAETADGFVFAERKSVVINSEHDDTDKDHLCDICGETLSDHTYDWQSENGQYWQECGYCGDETEKKDIPEIIINAPDTVCRTQNCEISATLPTDITDAVLSVEFAYFGGAVYLTVENGMLSYIVEASNYPDDENSFNIVIYATTADGFPFEVSKIVQIQDKHAGGKADCSNKPVCDTCGEEYGEVDSTNHNLEHIPAKAATVTENGNTEYWHCKDCDKCFADENGKNEIGLSDTVIAKLPPEIIKGAGQSVTEGEKKVLSFTSNAAYSDFIRVEIDGITLDSENYTVAEGSTVVTLKADYVAKLSVGKHTIGVVSENGTAETTFTVNAKTVNNPDTGDNSHMVLWIALALVSGSAMLGATVAGKKKKSSAR